MRINIWAHKLIADAIAPQLTAVDKKVLQCLKDNHPKTEAALEALTKSLPDQAVETAFERFEDVATLLEEQLDVRIELVTEYVNDEGDENVLLTAFGQLVLQAA